MKFEFVARAPRPRTCESRSGLSGGLLYNILLFGRVLRGLGLEINPGRMMDLASALDQIAIGNKSDFFYAARWYRSLAMAGTAAKWIFSVVRRCV